MKRTHPSPLSGSALAERSGAAAGRSCLVQTPHTSELLGTMDYIGLKLSNNCSAKPFWMRYKCSLWWQDWLSQMTPPGSLCDGSEVGGHLWCCIVIRMYQSKGSERSCNVTWIAEVMKKYKSGKRRVNANRQDCLLVMVRREYPLRRKKKSKP